MAEGGVKGRIGWQGGRDILRRPALEGYTHKVPCLIAVLVVKIVDVAAIGSDAAPQCALRTFGQLGEGAGLGCPGVELEQARVVTDDQATLRRGGGYLWHEHRHAVALLPRRGIVKARLQEHDVSPLVTNWRLISKCSSQVSVSSVHARHGKDRGGGARTPELRGSRMLDGALCSRLLPTRRILVLAEIDQQRPHMPAWRMP